VIVSSVEHNAVMRPLNALKERGIDYTRIMCDKNGAITAEDILPAIKPNTKGVVMTHASNVSGTILSLEKVGDICKKNGLNFIIDVAQTAGIIPVDFQKFGADAVAFTGHKSLLGPQGVGGFLITNQLADQMSTFIEGGTGSLSDHEIQPHYMPDKFEAGTQNMPGIYGLNAALQYIMKEGTETLHHKEMVLMEIFLEALMNMDHIRIVGRKDTEQRVGIVSVDFIHGDNGEMAYRLYSDSGIMTRSGMHCAPSAHQTLGTFPRGTVRFGLSHFMEKADICYAIDQINKLR
jgi:selenocysteine lyase/cysteine desulfurase